MLIHLTPPENWRHATTLKNIQRALMGKKKQLVTCRADGGTNKHKRAKSLQNGNGYEKEAGHSHAIYSSLFAAWIQNADIRSVLHLSVTAEQWCRHMAKEHTTRSLGHHHGIKED